MRAAAYAHHVGVADQDIDRFHGYRQQRRHHLREARLVTLPRWLRADYDPPAPRGSDADLGALIGRTDRVLDVVREAAPEEPSARGGALSASFATFPVGDLHRTIHVGLVGAAVVGHPHRVPVGHRFRPDELLSDHVY